MKIISSILLLILIQSCSQDLSRYGKVKEYRSANGVAFLFKVEESFTNSHNSTNRDKGQSMMNGDETSLLNRLLVKGKLCLDQYNYPNYKITSKQKKIYDITFANLIEQNYNAKSVTPLTYYGQCL